MAPASLTSINQPVPQKLKPKKSKKHLENTQRFTESHILDKGSGFLGSAYGRWKEWINLSHSLSRCHCDTARSGFPGYMRCNPWFTPEGYVPDRRDRHCDGHKARTINAPRFGLRFELQIACSEHVSHDPESKRSQFANKRSVCLQCILHSV